MPASPQLLNLDGIPSEKPRGEDPPHLWHDPQGVWRLSKGDRSNEVDNVCSSLHHAFRDAIMQGVDFWGLLQFLPSYVSSAGLGSEGALSSIDFQRYLKEDVSYPELNRFLYYYDCMRLVSSIQECSKEVCQIVGEFYFTLNTEPFFTVAPPEREDDLRWSSSPTTTKLTAFINFIFVRLHSLLDYSVKLATEVERLRQDFSTYPKMASQGKQFGDRKGLSFNGKAGTLFEHCHFVAGLETLRNHIIHDALLDEMPKAYERYENWKVVERFVLFPDMTAGRLDRHVNRSLFFGVEDKINLRLSGLVTEFQRRLEKTLGEVLDTLEKRYKIPAPVAKF